MKIFARIPLISGLLILGACIPPRRIQPPPVPVSESPAPVVETSSREKIRIGIRIEVNSSSISCDHSFYSKDLSSGIEMKWPAGQYDIKSKDGNVYLDGKALAPKIRLFTHDEKDILHCQNIGYRGDLLVYAKDDQLTVINETSIDNYLAGVLPREVVMSWHEEALKVQAVASRTYLASHLGHHSKQGFDLCSEVHCQVYGGISRENSRTNQAVVETQGQILVYNGKPIGAFFHSNCGGTTEEIGPVWGSANVPYLPRKKCDYGTADPRYSWKIILNSSTILDTLVKKTKVTGSKLGSLRIGKKSASGRAEQIIVETNQGRYTLSGNQFRIALNPEKIRSTLLTDLRRVSDGYEFSGRGWGHGVGMCQWGSKGQAEQGRSYQQILSFYYPHTELTHWSR